MRLAPHIETERLTLRPIRPEDFPAMAALWASPRAVNMGGPLDQRAAWGWFCHDAAGWALFGFGALMIDLRVTGATIGQVGLNAGPHFPEVELGWVLYDGFEGQGYATEAAAALRDWAFETQGFDSLVSYTDPGNDASHRVAERLGALADPTANRPDPDDVVFRHRRQAA